MISLAWPLTYGELLTKRALYYFSAVASVLALVTGVLAVGLSGDGEVIIAESANSSSSTSCISVFRRSKSFASFQMVHFCVLVAPGAVAILACSLYVYAVASRHAKDIRKVQRTVRKKQEGETKSQMGQPQSQVLSQGQPSQVQGLPTQQRLQHQQSHETSNLLAPPSPQLGNTSSNHQHNFFSFGGLNQASSLLVPTRPTLSTAPNGGGPSSVLGPASSLLHIDRIEGAGRRSRRGSAISHFSRRRARLSYASTLGITALSFFLCRLPRSLYFLLSPPTPNEDLLAQLLCLPFLIGCALDPWLYAYHNLDLKPLMRRRVRKLVGLESAGWQGRRSNRVASRCLNNHGDGCVSRVDVNASLVVMVTPEQARKGDHDKEGPSSLESPPSSKKGEKKLVEPEQFRIHRTLTNGKQASSARPMIVIQSCSSSGGGLELGGSVGEGGGRLAKVVPKGDEKNEDSPDGNVCSQKQQQVNPSTRKLPTWKVNKMLVSKLNTVPIITIWSEEKVEEELVLEDMFVDMGGVRAVAV